MAQEEYKIYRWHECRSAHLSVRREYVAERIQESEAYCSNQGMSCGDCHHVYGERWGGEDDDKDFRLSKDNEHLWLKHGHSIKRPDGTIVE